MGRIPIGELVLACAERATRYWERAQAGAIERALAHGLSGKAHYLNKDFETAIRILKEAIQMGGVFFEARKEMALGLQTLGDAERLSGKLDEAEDHYEQALTIARSTGYAEGVAYVIGNQAALRLDRADWIGAEAYAREALRLAETVGRQELIASDCRRLAHALCRQRRYDEAIIYACRAVRIYTQLGSPRLEAASETLKECDAGLVGVSQI